MGETSEGLPDWLTLARLRLKIHPSPEQSGRATHARRETAESENDDG